MKFPLKSGANNFCYTTIQSPGRLVRAFVLYSNLHFFIQYLCKVTITNISDEDSYFSEKSRFIGKTGVVADDPLETSSVGKGWYSGAIKIDDANGTNYFYAVAVSDGSTSASTAPVRNSERETTATIPEGSKVMILSISPEDAYYDDRENIERKVGKVIETLTLSDMGDGWYGGEIILEGESDSLYFYAVAVKLIKK